MRATLLRIGLLVSLGVVHAQSQTGPVTWIASGLERVRPTDPVKTNPSVTLYAGKGEYEPFQIIIHAGSTTLTNVNVSVSALQGPGTATIAASNIVLYREQYVYLSKPSFDYGRGNVSQGAGW